MSDRPYRDAAQEAYDAQNYAKSSAASGLDLADITDNLRDRFLAWLDRNPTPATPGTTNPGGTTGGTTTTPTGPVTYGGATQPTGQHTTGLVPLQRVNRLNIDLTNAPIRADSSEWVAKFVEHMRQWGPDATVSLNCYDFTTTFYRATRTTPRVDVIRDTPDYIPPEWTSDIGHQVPIDPTWAPAEGTDQHISIYLPESEGGSKGGDLWEFWIFTPASKSPTGQPTAQHGGHITNLAHSEGVYTYPFGVAASGLAQPPMCISLAEARGTKDIDHAIYLAVGPSYTGDVWPANRNDGWDGYDPHDTLEGMRYRLDPTLNVDALDLHPLARTVAKAAQRYGLIAGDKTADQHAIPAESGHLEQLATGSNPWNAIIGPDHTNWNVLNGIPWDRLQLVEVEYGKSAVDACTTEGLTSGLPGGVN